MKSSASPRRPVKKVRLDLRRAATPPPPEDDVAARRNRTFWRWFGVVALFHVLLFIVVAFLMHEKPAPPPDQFMSLEPLGNIVKGTPGEQSAPKVGTSTPAPAHHRHHPHPTPPVPQPQPTPPPAVTPPQPVIPPVVVQPPPPPVPTPAPVPNLVPVVKQTTPPVPPKKKVKPKPVKPKLKVNLDLQDGPPVEQPVKPVHKHVKKTVAKPTEDQSDDSTEDSADSNTTGLSKEQIARKLGEKLDDSGVKNSTLIGKSGSVDGQDNPLNDFYNSIAQQIENKYQTPNQDDLQAVNPLIQIHVDPDGRVPADQVTILRSSGNQAIDAAVLSAAKSIGYTLQPLPHGCNPDISINFQLTH